MSAVRLGQKFIKQQVRARISIVSNIFDFTDICQKFQLFPWHSGTGQEGSEAIGTGSNPSLCLEFLTLMIRRKVVIPLLSLMNENFRTRIFLKPERVPLRNFSVL